MPRGKKISQIKWTWATKQFVVRHADGSTRYAKKRERLPSGAIAEAVGKAGRFIPVAPYRVGRRMKA